jgi:glutamine amidotransferase
MGNVGSIANMLKRIGAEPVVSSDPVRLAEAERLILPGVGAFDTGMSRLKESGLQPFLEDAVFSRKIPLLGICLGMQLLGRSSEEGTMSGLGWIDAVSRRFTFPPEEPRLKVPHMGWTTVVPVPGANLFVGSDSEQRFYFVHAYHVICANLADVQATATYGATFTAAIRKGPVHGVQFHPEKSHRYGVALMRQFVGP